MIDVASIADELSAIPLDTEFLQQDALDLVVRERTSLYPWRGQFSPGLVDLLLGAYAGPDDVVLDPFVGSGTTLFEATRRGHECIGAEINPGAAIYASVARMAAMSASARERRLSDAEQLLADHIGVFLELNLFQDPGERRHETLLDALRAVTAAADDESVYAILAASLMLAMGHDAEVSASAVMDAFRRNCVIVRNLPRATRPCTVYCADARDLPIDGEIVDLVITSPPYINVFNYHQYHRTAIELLGCDALRVAQSEIGANRKHRGNRFLTVIQFSLDMFEAFHEFCRVLRFGGKAVVVVGHESNVRGVSFNNGMLLAILAKGVGMNLERWQRRKFTNRFGKRIYEDILTLTNETGSLAMNDDFARRVGIWALHGALDRASGDVRQGVEAALERAADVRPSLLATVRPVAPSAVT